MVETLVLSLNTELFAGFKVNFVPPSAEP